MIGSSTHPNCFGTTLNRITNKELRIEYKKLIIENNQAPAGAFLFAMMNLSWYIPNEYQPWDW